jgi:beta-lactamase class D
MKRSIFLMLVCLVLLSLPVAALAQDNRWIPDLGAIFGDYEGTFVLYDSQRDITLHYNAARAAQPFPPCSTFKILNAAIALETGIAPDADFLIEWDPSVYPLDHLVDEEPFTHWRQDHTLRSSLEYSVVWFHTELALLAGQETMQSFLDQVGYGNADASSWMENGVPFWLGGSLRISADQQLDFLRAFYNQELPFSDRTTHIVRDILPGEVTDAYRFTGKTGGCPLEDGTPIGWYVGYVETADNVVVFASNSDAVGDTRIELARRILVVLGVLPE